jgi:cytoskeleton protein RodZ
MTLTAAAPFIRPEPPRWTVEITSSRRSVRLLAERGGKLFPAASPPLGPPRIVIHATVNAWIRVLNVDQSVLFDDILKAGSSYSVPNIPGVTLRTGLAGSLDITVDGKLVPSIGGSRHDILLEPQALIAGTAIQD